MKYILLFVAVCCFACTEGKYAGVPEKYHLLLDKAFEKAGTNVVELEKALKDAPENQKEGMAFLIAYMPEREVFETTPLNMLIALIFYILVIMLIQLMRWKSLQDYHQVQIKQEKKYQEKLVEAAKQAEAANAAKTVFLQRMSHDIRTPINGILGLIEISEYYSDDLEKQEECRDKIRESSKLLLDLVNEVLDMGKLESGEIFLEERPFNLLQMMDETVGSANRSAKKRGITIYRGEWDIPHPCLVGSSLYFFKKRTVNR